LQWTAKALALATVVLRFFYHENLLANAFTSAASLFLSWFLTFFYLRGFENVAWIVIALSSIAKSMKYFVLVLAIIIFTFALVLRAIYDGGKYPDTPAFGNIWKAFRTTLFAGMFGDFDLDILDQTFSRELAEIVMVIMLTVVLLISLNALIAFISDAFEKVLAQKQGVLKKQRAQMIVEAYSSLTEEERTTVQERHRWTSLVIPVATLEVQEPKAADKNYAKATKEDMKILSKTIKVMKKDIDTIKVMKKDIDEVKDGIEGMKGMKEDIDEIKDGMKGIKESNNGMKDGIKENNNGIKEDMNGIKEDMNGMKEGMKGIKKDVDGIKESIDAMMKLMKGAKKEEK